MCQSHHPSDISRRGLAGLVVAGAGLALTPSRASADEAPAVAKTLCLMCIDHAFVGDAMRFFDSVDGPGRGRYDVVALAGASLAGKSPRAPGRPFQFTHTFAALREQLLFAKQPAGVGAARHPDIEKVVVFDHLGCGAYKNEYGTMTRAQEIVRHREVANTVRQWLSSPQIGLDSSFWLVGEPGGRVVPFPYNIS